MGNPSADHPAPAPRLFAHLGAVIPTWRDDDPGATALITEARTWSVAELGGLIDTQRRALDVATAPGSRIGVRAANSADLVALLYAVPASGRVLVPVNTRLTDAEAAAQLHRADVALLVGDAVDGFDGPTVTLADLGDLAGSAAPTSDDVVGRTGPAEDPTDDVAWLIFTSGSTGAPKGALLTHASLAAAVTATAAARPLADDEVYLYPFPLFHVAAYNVLHAHARRRPVVLPDRFDARRIIELCHTHRVTALSVAATMLRMLLEELDHGDLGPPPTLRTVAYGAAPMPVGLLREAARVLDCGFAQGYGSTELSGNAVFLGPDAHERGLAGEPHLLTAAGWAAPGVQVRIVDAEGAAVAPGTPGEITVAADQVFAGYLDDPDTTAATVRDGWLHTGDVGTLDADGLLRIVDRAKDIVVTGGENVASREVEDVIRTAAGVADVAVVATPDDRWGEAVTAVVVRSPAARPDHSSTPDPPSDPGEGRPPVAPAPTGLRDDLAAHVRRRLAGYKVPKRWFVADALPVNANGKIDKPRLRALLAESSGIVIDS